jgi:hypothetical protein
MANTTSSKSGDEVMYSEKVRRQQQTMFNVSKHAKLKKRTTRMDFHEPLLPRNTMV